MLKYPGLMDGTQWVYALKLMMDTMGKNFESILAIGIPILVTMFTLAISIF